MCAHSGAARASLLCVFGLNSVRMAPATGLTRILIRTTGVGGNSRSAIAASGALVGCRADVSTCTDMSTLTYACFNDPGRQRLAAAGVSGRAESAETERLRRVGSIAGVVATSTTNTLFRRFDSKSR